MSNKHEGKLIVVEGTSFPPIYNAGVEKTLPEQSITCLPTPALFRWTGGRKRKDNRKKLQIAGKILFGGDVSSTASTDTSGSIMPPSPKPISDITFVPTADETMKNLFSVTETFEREWIQDLVSVPSGTWCPPPAAPQGEQEGAGLTTTDCSKPAMAAILSAPTVSFDQASSSSQEGEEEVCEAVSSMYQSQSSENSAGLTSGISTEAVNGEDCNGRVGKAHNVSDFAELPLFVKVDPIQLPQEVPEDDDVSMSSFAADKELESNFRDIFEDCEGFTAGCNDSLDWDDLDHLYQHQQHRTNRRWERTDSFGFHQDNYDDGTAFGDSYASFGDYDGFSVMVPEVRDEIEEMRDGPYERRLRRKEASAYNFVDCDYSCSLMEGMDEDDHVDPTAAVDSKELSKVPKVVFYE